MNQIVEDALRITTVLNKHMMEDPECVHTVKEITKEIFA